MCSKLAIACKVRLSSSGKLRNSNALSTLKDCNFSLSFLAGMIITNELGCAGFVLSFPSLKNIDLAIEHPYALTFGRTRPN